jgi:hypothetical protein
MSAKRVRPPQMKPELQLTLQLGIALAMLLAGGVMTLSALGILPPDEDAGPLTRLLVLLIGLLLASFSVTLVAHAFWVLAEQAGARDLSSALSLALSGLLDRVDLKSAGSALLLAPLAIAYWRAVEGLPLWGWSRDALIGGVMIEFLVIHGFVFLVGAVTFATIPERWPRLIGSAAVVGLAALYAALAWEIGGVWGVASLIYLALPNVLAFARPRNESGPRVTAGMRWMVQLFTFCVIAALLDHRELRGEGNLEVGLYYFAILTLVELFRVSEITLDLAPRWARLPHEKRHAVLPPATHG